MKNIDKTFYLYLKERNALSDILLCALHLDYKPGWRYTGGRIPSSYSFVLQIGKGAGYRWGVSFFLARNSGSRRWQLTYRGRADRNFAPFGFELGWTRNGNRVPYVSH